LVYLEKKVTHLRLQVPFHKQCTNFSRMLPYKKCWRPNKLYNLITFSDFTKHIYTHEKRFGVAVTLQTCTQNVPKLHLGQDCGC